MRNNNKNMQKNTKNTHPLFIFFFCVESEQVFLRNSVFEPLEEKLRILLQVKVILLQKVWRGFKARRGELKIHKTT